MTMRAVLSLGFVTAAILAPITCNADTTVAVLEFGKGESVRRTTASSSESTAAGVESFWNVMHRRTKRTVQNAGMPVVPDLFKSADAGVVVGISGNAVDVTAMPTTSSLLSKEKPDNVIGHITVKGKVGNELMRRASAKEVVEGVSDKASFENALLNMSKKASGGFNGIETVSLVVDNESAAAEADESLRRMLKHLEDEVSSSGKTVVVHLVLEEKEGSPRRNFASSGHRRLDENDKDNENEGDNDNGNPTYSEGRYGNVGGKTMYQIQTFNIYLWTAIGMFIILSMAIGAFMSMPLMADTLLFGEAMKSSD